MKEMIKLIKDYQNPYPHDIFKWDNHEKLDFDRGRFNRHCFEIVEHTRQDIIKLIEENLTKHNNSPKKDCYNSKCPINIRNNKSKMECPNKCLDRKNQPMYNYGHSDY